MKTVSKSVPTLQRLLAELLPLQQVGPALRRAARRALASGDPGRMLPAARAVVAELLRRGDLVRVVVQGPARVSLPTYMLRSTAQIIDLSVLNEPVARRPDRAESGGVATAPSAEKTTTVPGNTFLASFARVLAAMERAQNLRVGDPQSGEREVVLDRILALLSQFVPGLQMFILLHGQRRMDYQTDRILHGETDRHLPSWLVARTHGTEFWIPSWQELPDDVKLAFVKLTREMQEDEATVAARFEGGVMVPVLEPNWLGEDRDRGGPEAGLLFILPTLRWRTRDLFRLGRQLSRFVTRRWRHQREVNQRIHSDSLTGVYNRAFFDTQFPNELERAKRDKSALTLVLGDLDHFKEVNDRHGHQVGDLVLRSVAQELQGAMRRIDYVCRTGGEEFAIILPNTPAAAAQEVLARLLARLADMVVQVPERDESPGITLSLGAVTYPAGGSDPEELYRKADSMLYLSKATGRNRCHFWNPEGEPIRILPEPTDS